MDVLPKENVGLRQRRFRAARTISDWEMTVRDLEAIVDDIDPAALTNDEPACNALVNNELAWLLANCQEVEFRHPARAVERAQKAVELVPGNGSFWNTLGVANYRAGDWSAALAALEKSDELLEGQMFSFNGYFLAMAHCQLGRHDEARQWYAKSVKWMDDNMSNNEELVRFRAEAEQTLELTVGGGTYVQPPPPPPLPEPTDN
jgi:tetratricopeptide (TPR) repeat protein